MAVRRAAADRTTALLGTAVPKPAPRDSVCRRACEVVARLELARPQRRYRT
jgi:hypothetical protein